ncbi:MAG: NAD-dependent epimerase/dehydratase family protein [Candidatus Omnitrophota bacterium]
MRILITGGAGLVGSHAAEYFANKGNKVIVFDNLMRSKLFGYDRKSVEYNWKYLSKLKNITCIKGDIRNETEVKKALGKGVDLVIHAAGQPGVAYSIKYPLEDFSINAFGTLNVLECIRKICKKATFIYCSTNKVYGENVSKIALTEMDSRYVFKELEGINEQMPTDLTGHTAYGVSKLTGDLYTQDYTYIHGMRTAVFRMSCIYGTRQFGFEDQGWIAWFIIASLFNKPITIYGDGKQVRDALYADDLVAGFEVFFNSNLKSALYNIGGGPENTLSLLEFLEHLTKDLGRRPRYTFGEWRASDQKVYISDISKIKKELNWQPKINVNDGLNRLIEWVKNNKQYFS